MPAVVMLHEKDPKAVILDKLGDITDFGVWNNQVLCAVYERPDVKTSGGLLLPDTIREEDRFQGKVCLVVKMGPDAFEDDGNWTFKDKAQVGDWVWFRTSDSFAVTVNGKLCRVVKDTDIRGTMPHPDMVW